ncbi:MAG: Peptide chain release factor 1 [candidate division TM6 bacterium GW2011_GWF2_37_49]|nr:MAG: Peptide chain release factor 1 [candidate division TM6 bacterium GW2011_GWF2_37_49]
MLDWNKVQVDYDVLVEKLSDINIETRQRAALQKQASFYSDILDLHKQIVACEQNIKQCQLQISQEEGEMKELYEAEIHEIETILSKLTSELEDVLYPVDELDSRSVFVEIRAGAGGQESALFASELFRMYSLYSEARGWRTSIVDYSTTDLGGYKDLIVNIEGKNVYKYLKHESGVHRVQRVPKTETAGRVHTSTVTVAVLPEVDEVDVNINPADLRIDTYRAGGAGGQHVNKTDSAVRLTHIPTGLVVCCQDERSQIKNRAKAMKVMQARLFEQERERREAVEREQRRAQVGTGERAEKIRTYNFPQNRITDHRTEVTLKKLDLVMDGDLNDILNPLIELEKSQRRAKDIVFEAK